MSKSDSKNDSIILVWDYLLHVHLNKSLFINTPDGSPLSPLSCRIALAEQPTN